jgi:hypothetical protein
MVARQAEGGLGISQSGTVASALVLLHEDPCGVISGTPLGLDRRRHDP